MEQDWRLLIDAGGTNVRFGRADRAHAVRDTVSLPTRSFARFEDALVHYLGQLGSDITFTSAAVAGAGPVKDGEIRLTNNAWRIRADDIARILGANVSVRLVNDLEAVAYGLPYFEPGDVNWIAPPQAGMEPQQRMLAINVGTGFGSACVIRSRSGWVACPSEAGHMTLGAVDAAELTVQVLFGAGALTVEDVLSGDGVAHLRTLLAQGDERNAAAADAGAWFGAWLARVSTNLALASASWDGVFFCGSVVSAWWRTADLAEFHNQFIGNGKMRDQLRRTPVGLIEHDWPAFVGLSNQDII